MPHHKVVIWWTCPVYRPDLSHSIMSQSGSLAACHREFCVINSSGAMTRAWKARIKGWTNQQTIQAHWAGTTIKGSSQEWEPRGHWQLMDRHHFSARSTFSRSAHIVTLFHLFPLFTTGLLTFIARNVKRSRRFTTWRYTLSSRYCWESKQEWRSKWKSAHRQKRHLAPVEYLELNFIAVGQKLDAFNYSCKCLSHIFCALHRFVEPD